MPDEQAELIAVLLFRKAEIEDWIGYIPEAGFSRDRARRLMNDAEDELKAIDDELLKLDAPLTANELAELRWLLNEDEETGYSDGF